MGVNLFTVENMLNMAGYSYTDVRQNGGLFLVGLEFDCNLDEDTESCLPDTHVTRLDTPGGASTGFNFRYIVQNTNTTGFQSRDL